VAAHSFSKISVDCYDGMSMIDSFYVLKVLFYFGELWSKSLIFISCMSMKIAVLLTWDVALTSGKETEFPIEPELTLELMMAANYLHT